jgi:predicted aminopeptidase
MATERIGAFLSAVYTINKLICLTDEIMSIMFRFIIFFLALLLTFRAGPKNGSYLFQAISGHFRIMCSRVPIKKILKKNQTDIETGNKLKLVLQVRKFATIELGLPKNKSYTFYSEINDKYPGWNVYCAPKFSVEPRLWCFPIAGCVIYRGYFSKKDAFEFAKSMTEKDFDVFVGPFNAYSTLGWYNDPILSSHMLLDSIHLAGLIIHELAHQKIYVSGDSRFNEGFAVSVERSGVLKWLKSIGREDQIVQAVKMWDEEDMIITKILKSRSRLNDIYLSVLDTKFLSQKKDSVLYSLKMDLCNGNCAGIKLPMSDGEDFEYNNAYFVPLEAYYSLVPVFHRIIDSCAGNYPQFYKRVAEFSKLPYDERQHKMVP